MHDCSSLIFFWEFNGVGGPEAPARNRIRGISYQQVDHERRVLSHNVEFNSLAWAENTGFTIEFPTEGTYAQDPPETKKKRGARFYA